MDTKPYTVTQGKHYDRGPKGDDAPVARGVGEVVHLTPEQAAAFADKVEPLEVSEARARVLRETNEAQQRQLREDEERAKAERRGKAKGGDTAQ